MENALIVIKKESSKDIFTTPNGINDLLEEIKTKALVIAPDVSTAKGRQEITDELKALPKIVDENRRVAKNILAELQEEIRKPLTAWEEEQARIEAEKKAEEEAKALAEQIERDYELALLMNSEFDRKKKEEAERIERERVEREAQIAREAQERANREARAKIQAAKEAEERARLEAQLAKERAEREAREAEERRIKELKAQEERLKLEAEEKQKQAEEQAKREAAEREKAEANKAHRRKVNAEIVKSLVENCGLTEEQAKQVVIATVNGNTGRLKIDYSIQ